MADTRLQTTATSLAIPVTLRERDGARVTEVADDIDRPTSTVSHHLNTLLDAEFVVKRGDEYHPSLRFLEFGHHVSHRRPEYELAAECVRRLNDETGLRALFAVAEHGRAVVVHKESGEQQALRHVRPGQRLHLHDTAVGKAILAELPDSRVEAVVDRHGLPRATEATTTDPSALRDELETVRERGYALNLAENIDGLHAVGTAVDAPDFVGAFSVAGAARALDRSRLEADVADTLLAVVDEFELEVEYS